MSENRWIILTASIVINLSVGSVYAWSVFQKPLIAMFNWTTSEVNMAFTISLSLVPVAMILAGRIQDKKGPRMVILAGSLIFGGGIIATGFIKSLGQLYWTYGVMGGLGIGTIYACTIANTVKWFPDCRGLAAGLVAGGFGSGAMVLAPIAASLVESYGVLFAFNILGIVYLFAISISAIFVQMPPTGYMPSGWTPPAVAASTSIVTGYDKNWKEMLSDPLFYVFWALYAIGCVSGLMIIGHASPIGQEMLKLSAKTAALTLSFLAMGNTAGRIFWGWVSDKVGRYHALMSMYLLAGITMSLIGFVSTVEAFVLALMLVGLCFGGFLGIFPSITADMFGAKNLGMNYGIMFTAYGLAAYVGPRLASTIKESNNGDYTQAFVLSASLSLLGIAMTYAASYRRKRLLAQR